MKKFFHNVIAMFFYLATAGVLSLAIVPVLGNLAREIFEPLGLWGGESIWFLLVFTLVLCAVSAFWTLAVCRAYFRLIQWCTKHRGLGWMAVQSW